LDGSADSFNIRGSGHHHDLEDEEGNETSSDDSKKELLEANSDFVAS